MTLRGPKGFPLTLPYRIGIDEAAFSKFDTKHYCSNLCISKISFQSIVECVNKFHSRNGNSRRQYFINSMASNAHVTKGDKKKRSIFTMRLDTIDAYQNVRYKCHGIKGITFFNYKSMFLNGDVRVVHGNSGLEKNMENNVFFL